ncbi:hypothetical protein JCM25156A_16920 [Komagataeibacter kakiaceti JCM 25156]|uniref:hypothetical protein n=1 Tax=Komagataeibacter kakiaceti TaxID=943261 RepID=UPI00047291F5|nr:hypothetical protein [Komagataeibacter kakiaceti]
MGYVTVTGATGLTLGINQDSSQIIQGLQQVGEQTALKALSSLSAASGVDAVAVAGGVICSAESTRAAGVQMIDGVIRAAAGAQGVQEITQGGVFTAGNSVSAIDIGSTTSALLDQGMALAGGDNAINVMDGNLGTVEFNAGAGDVNYYAAGGNTVFVSGTGNDLVHTMGGSDTVYGYAGTPTVSGAWNAPDSSTATFNGGGSSIEVIDGVMVRNESNDTITTYDDGGFFEGEYTRQTINTVQGGQDDVISGQGRLVVDSVSDSSINSDGALSVTGGSNDTISASMTTQIEGTENSVIQVSVPGTLTFIGGANGVSDTVTGSNATIFGTAGLDLAANGSGGMTCYAGSGNETLDGGLSGGTLRMVAGSGNDTLIGGNGQAMLQAGTGNDVLRAGHDATEFDFIKGQAGGADIIQDFAGSSGNIVRLSGYDTTPASIQSMLEHATVAGGNTTIGLEDSTRITFVGVTDLKAQNFKT